MYSLGPSRRPPVGAVRSSCWLSPMGPPWRRVGPSMGAMRGAGRAVRWQSRRRERRAYPMERSPPAYLLPMRLATTPVVPMPEKGSSTSAFCGLGVVGAGGAVAEDGGASLLVVVGPAQFTRLVLAALVNISLPGGRLRAACTAPSSPPAPTEPRTRRRPSSETTGCTARQALPASWRSGAPSSVLSL